MTKVEPLEFTHGGYTLRRNEYGDWTVESPYDRPNIEDITEKPEYPLYGVNFFATGTRDPFYAVAYGRMILDAAEAADKFTWFRRDHA